MSKSSASFSETMLNFRTPHKKNHENPHSYNNLCRFHHRRGGGGNGILQILWKTVRTLDGIVAFYSTRLTNNSLKKAVQNAKSVPYGETWPTARATLSIMGILI